jgi:hypothetical protein
MRQIELAKKLAIISIVIITVIFLGEISPLKGLGILTWSILEAGILLWLTSLLLLIVGLFNRKKENEPKKNITMALLLTLGFIPLGFMYMTISGNIRTKITVSISNQSDFIPGNVLIYGTGNIFESTDTLKVASFKKGEKIEYVIQPSTAPHRHGYIRMEFDVDNKHISKEIAGEFSINPYNIKQEWEVVIDNEFVK